MSHLLQSIRCARRALSGMHFSSAPRRKRHSSAQVLQYHAELSVLGEKSPNCRTSSLHDPQQDHSWDYQSCLHLLPLSDRGAYGVASLQRSILQVSSLRLVRGSNGIRAYATVKCVQLCGMKSRKRSVKRARSSSDRGVFLKGFGVPLSGVFR